MGGVVAETLRRRGHEVTLVTPSPIVSAWTVNTLEQEKIRRQIMEADIAVVSNANLVAIRAGEVDLACTFTGRTWTVSADNVLMVTARLPNGSLFVELAARREADQMPSIRTLTRIGDCIAPGAIVHAVFNGRRAAEDLDQAAAEILSFRTEPVATDRPAPLSRRRSPHLLAAE